jgi:hypothetical protein
MKRKEMKRERRKQRKFRKGRRYTNIHKHLNISCILFFGGAENQTQGHN